MSESRIETYEEFWALRRRTSLPNESAPSLPRYIGRPHPGAQCGGDVTVVALLLAPLIGYNAWVGHFLIEKNKPASFSYPGWSFISDIKMLNMALIGRMGSEVERLYGSRHPAPDAPCLVKFSTRS